MEASVARIVIAVVMCAVALTMAVGFVGQILEGWEKRKKEEERKRHPWDPVLCPHEWESCESGTCDRGPQGWLGDGRPQWKVEVCAHCGTRRFSCSYDRCAHRAECAATHEAGSPEPGTLERHLIDRVADRHGFEYQHYLLRDRFGNQREGWCRVVPTTIAFACPDCGGMVGGVDARRVWPGTTGPDPTAFRCERCGREETYDFGVPRVGEREGDPVFTEPAGAQPACPRGGRHEWELVEEWSEMDFPEGVDACIENLHLVEEVWHRRFRCAKCGAEETA